MAGEKEDKNQVLYVGVKEPVELRRTILESTKDAVEILQEYEKFRAIREEKIKTVDLLKDQIKDLTKLVSKLKASLPKVDIRIRLHKEQEAIESEKRAEKEAKKSKKKPAKKKEAPKKTKDLGDLEKLEAELTSIEQKLGKV